MTLLGSVVWELDEQFKVMYIQNDMLQNVMMQNLTLPAHNLGLQVNKVVIQALEEFGLRYLKSKVFPTF